MVVPKINSSHGSETRNIINTAIDSINAQGKSIQDLVAEGQLTPTQYANLIQTVNGLISKGGVTLDDLSSEVLKEFGEVSPTFNLLSIPREKSVTPSKTTFLKIGKNLFNKNNIVQGELISQTSGNPQANASNWRTKDFIPVEPGVQYTISPWANSNVRIAFYSEQDLSSFISGTITEQTFTIPGAANYVLFSSPFNVNSTQFERGTTGTEYEPYTITPTFEVVGSNSITTGKIAPASVTPDKTDFISQSKNIFTKKDAVYGYSMGSGGWTENSGYNTTKPIPIKPNTEYIFTAEIVGYVFFEGENFIGNGITSSSNRTIKTPYEATHLRLYMTTDRWRGTNLQLEEGNVETPYVPNVKTLSSEIQVQSESSKLNGKHILFIGDSNTHIYTWPNKISERTGAITYNGGMGATRLTDRVLPDETYFYNYLNGCAIADAIATGDFQELEHYGGLIDEDVQNSNPDYLEQIQNIKDAYSNISNLDSIVLSYGTNDVSNNANTLGEEDSFDRRTWCGAINYVVKRIGEAHPHIKIFFATPPFRAKMPNTTGIDSDEGIEGRLYMPEMAEKMVKITKTNHLPCLDLYFKSGINKYTATEYLNDREIDGIHYNENGREHISHLYQAFLENNGI